MSPESHVVSVKPLYQLAVLASQEPAPLPVVEFVWLGSQLRVCAFAAEEAMRMVAIPVERTAREDTTEIRRNEERVDMPCKEFGRLW
jgi:hypothetical protein